MLEIRVANIPDGELSTLTPIDTSKLLNENYLPEKLTLLDLSNNTKIRIVTFILSFTSILQFGQKTDATLTARFLDFSKVHGNMVTLKLRS